MSTCAALPFMAGQILRRFERLEMVLLGTALGTAVNIAKESRPRGTVSTQDANGEETS